MLGRGFDSVSRHTFQQATKLLRRARETEKLWDVLEQEVKLT